MKPIFVTALLLLGVAFVGCHKTSKAVADQTNGMGGARNWHIYTHQNIHRSITPDSAYYHDTSYWDADQVFALSVISSDSVKFDNTSYFYTHSEGSKKFFSIWHTSYSGNQGKITYNTDSNTIMIYRELPGVSLSSEYWYYSY